MFDAHPGARPLFAEMPIRIGTYDIDMHNHVNNGVYVRWLEDLRYEVLRMHYPPELLVAQGVMAVLHSTYIVYHRALRLFDEPLGRMWASKIGRATLTLEADFVVNGVCHAQATQRAMLVQIGTSKAARFPRELLDRFQAQNHEA